MSTAIVTTRSSTKDFKRVQNNYKVFSILGLWVFSKQFLGILKLKKTDKKNINYITYIPSEISNELHDNCSFYFSTNTQKNYLV